MYSFGPNGLCPLFLSSGKSKDCHVPLNLLEPQLFLLLLGVLENDVRLISASALFLASAFLAGATSSTAQTNWQVTKTLPVGGVGGWDYLTVDAPGHRLFVPRSTHTMVLDEDSGNVLGDIPGQTTAHGGGSGSIVIFDLKTYTVLGRLATLPDSDGIIYDAAIDRVLAVSGDGGALM